MANLIADLENEGKFDKEKIYKDFRALEVVKNLPTWDSQQEESSLVAA